MTEWGTSTCEVCGARRTLETELPIRVDLECSEADCSGFVSIEITGSAVRITDGGIGLESFVPWIEIGGRVH